MSLGRRPVKPGRATIAVTLGTLGLFVISMGAGWNNWPFGAVGAAMLIVAVALLTTASVGGAEKAYVAGTVNVVRAPEPPTGGTEYGRAEMHLLIEAAGHTGKTVVVRDPRVPVDRWPQVGDTLPALISIDDPRRVRIQWDRVGYYEEHPDQQDAESGEEVHTGFEFPIGPADDFSPPAERHRRIPAARSTWDDEDIPYSPTPDPLYSPDLVDAPATATDTVSDPTTGPAPDESGAGPDGLPAVAQAFADGPPIPLPRRVSSPGDSAADSAEPATRSSTEPLGPGEPGSSTVAIFASVENSVESGAASSAELPQPRTSPEELPEPPPARPASASTIQGVGITVLVSDLDRSLAFYRDTLGFYEVDGGDGNVVLASGATRIILRRASDAAPVNRRLVHLNLEVGDVATVYHELKLRGVRFTYPPRVVNSGERLELLAAAFKDPDGHGIAITQWQARSS